MRWRYIPIFLICMLVYAVIGGVIYHFIESDHEKDVAPQIRARVQEFLDKHPCVNLTRLLKLKLLLKKAEASGIHLNRETKSIVNISNWDVKNSIFLASQIIGAVGYGSSTPQTVGGKLFTVFFTIFGIPLFVILAFGVGKPIAKLVRHLEKRFCGSWVLHSRAKESQPVPHNKAEKKAIKKIKALRKFWVYFLRVFILFVIGSILFVLIPAIVFQAIEPWSYGESIYFCYTTVLSVGFGDFVPGEATEKSYRSWYRLATSVYVYVGVAFFVVVFSPIQEMLDYRKAINRPLILGGPDIDNDDAQSNRDFDGKFQQGGIHDWSSIHRIDPTRHRRMAVPGQVNLGYTGSYQGPSGYSPYIGRAPFGTHNSAPVWTGYSGGQPAGAYRTDNVYTTSGEGLRMADVGQNRVAQGRVTSVDVLSS